MISTTVDNNLASSWVATSSDALSNQSFLASSAFTIYPNPVSNRVTIQAGKPMTGVKIYSILGALLQEIKTNSQNLNLDLSAYSQGVYFITAYNEESFTVKKN
ncbi:Por secretion system C-terminal sorting domain-containing protein [Flavobacterium fryxellicola]|uniref:Secretion system C-terminal sorting domain-containing protein n=1 Tax=Flavobacterium fryxellicola TaxID=249352 RepID=A0A167XYN0_9FLAO|nr:T9SS type A sorting domain-containing protein [Flavobacterium fryxellicola]OAB28832.1 hypothetical protein FBFR_05015 [Flavobacterium fryxellicola]SHN61246.1 Por secretion system C-terminal sorting domain-containing protein [Flavobacterium fryxellicola]